MDRGLALMMPTWGRQVCGVAEDKGEGVYRKVERGKGEQCRWNAESTHSSTARAIAGMYLNVSASRQR
jgi:hypothetical protein